MSARLVSCRLCREPRERLPFVKYGPRHYAHASCGLRRWGVRFFGRLSRAELDGFPALVADKHGLLGELVRAIAAAADRPLTSYEADLVARADKRASRAAVDSSPFAIDLRVAAEAWAKAQEHEPVDDKDSACRRAWVTLARAARRFTWTEGKARS